MRILVCEDQDTIRAMIETLLQASGHEVVGVSFGAKAVEMALEEHFDILLLDLMMPGGLDGFDVCRRLREQESTRELPIFVISALDEPEKAFEAGATAFYLKPFRPLDLLNDINKVGSGKRPGRDDAS